MDAVLAKLVVMNDNGAAASGLKAENDYDMAFRVVLGTLIAMVLAGLCAAVLIVRDVARRIGSVLSPMRALATGDLTTNVPHQGESTGNRPDRRYRAGVQGRHDRQEGSRRSRGGRRSGEDAPRRNPRQGPAVSRA
jgi:methyl-accepting chemotaxis protein